MTKQPIQLQARYCPKCKTRMKWIPYDDYEGMHGRYNWECPKCDHYYFEED